MSRKPINAQPLCYFPRLACDAEVSGITREWRKLLADKHGQQHTARCYSRAKYRLGTKHYCKRHAEMAALDHLLRNGAADGEARTQG